jgi:copper(I)-binding protein
MKKLLSALFILIILSGCAANKTIKIISPWARPGKLDGNSAAYFILENNTAQDDRLVGVASPVSEMSELHMTKMDAQNKMMMMPQEFVDIPSAGKLNFEPGGYHVMLLNLKKDLQVGETIKITLNFEKAGKIEIDVPVKN